MTPEQLGEINRILDDLSALAIGLRCYGDHPVNTLILPAGKVVDTCRTIDDAVDAARRLLDLNRHSRLPDGTPPANDDAGGIS